MRRFIIVGHRAMTTADFTLNDLPGSSGRLDILARSITAALMLSHDIRRDVNVALVLLGPKDPPKTIRIAGNKIKYLNPDERSTGALIRNALLKFSASNNVPTDNDVKSTNHDPDTLPGELRTSPGIYISNNDFAKVLEHYSSTSDLIYLNESSQDVSELNPEGELSFILSDDKNFTPEEEQLIKKHSSQEISLGPMVYHTDHCVTIIHNYLDRLSGT